MLTEGDEYPIHQTAEPIAYAGTDRNFYDRFFFNGYSADGETFFAAAMGVYPHLNIIDGAVSILRGGKQTSIHLSRPLGMERMHTHIGPLSVKVIAPLKRVHLKLDATEGVALDAVFTGRAFPIEEPRFTRRQGPRTLMDVTRMTQNGHWSGNLRIDGEEITIGEGWTGTRDRSWGVRPIGAQDTQPLVPAMAPQFYWIWTPINFPNLSLFFHVNDDAEGKSWNTKSMLMMDGADQGGGLILTDPKMSVTYAKGTRRMASAQLNVKDSQDNAHKVTFTPKGTFLMKGIGYGHPVWRHGAYHGDQLAMTREDLDPKAPWQQPENLHIQELVHAVHEGPGGASSEGFGAFEQLFLGPHAPSGFRDILDGAV